MDWKWQHAVSGAVVAYSLWKIANAIKEIYAKELYLQNSTTTNSLTQSEQSDSTDEDNFNRLPSDVLGSITSLITMRDGYRMRVLSRRWRYRSVALGSHLNFDSRTMFNYSHPDKCSKLVRIYVEGVNQIVKEYAGPSICSFRVHFCLGRKFASDIDRWIRFAVLMGVQHLDLCFLCAFAFPNWSPMNYHMYTFSTQLLSEASRLEYLHLHYCKIKPNFNGQFHSLRILVLTEVPLGQAEMRHLLTRCLNLEKLRLVYCSFPSKISIDGPFIQLKHVTLEIPEDLQVLELSATKLTTFEYHSERGLIKFSFSQVPNLRDVYIYIPTWRTSVWNDLARHVPQLQCLRVASRTRAVCHEPYTSTTFQSLLQFEFSSSATRRLEFRNILHFLRFCPLLQNLKLMVGWVSEDPDVEFPSDNYLHWELKEVEIGGFCGLKSQVDFAVYLLQTAIALKRMILSRRVMRKTLFDEVWKNYEPVNLDFDRDKREWVPLEPCKREWVEEQLLGKAVSQTAVVMLDSVVIT